LKKIKYRVMTRDHYRLFVKELEITPLLVFQIQLDKIEKDLINELGGLATVIKFLGWSSGGGSYQKLEITKEMIMKEYNEIPLVKILTYLIEHRVLDFTKEELLFLKDNYKRGISTTSQILFGIVEDEELINNLSSGVSGRAKKILNKKIGKEDEEFSDGVKLFVKLM
jgi:hypothetical protein